MPANEHLTMQIARQVYKLQVAENVLVFFRNGEPAYITKRFDLKPDGMRHGQEDLASLAGRTKHTAGSDFIYDICFSNNKLQYMLPTDQTLYQKLKESDNIYQDFYEILSNENNGIIRFVMLIYKVFI